MKHPCLKHELSVFSIIRTAAFRMHWDKWVCQNPASPFLFSILPNPLQLYGGMTDK